MTRDEIRKYKMTRDEIRSAVLKFISEIDYDIAKEYELPEMEEYLENLIDDAIELFEMEEE